MIPPTRPDHYSVMTGAELAFDESLGVSGPASRTVEIDSASGRARLTAMVEQHHDFVWRSLRRLGVPLADVDDAAQRVFWVATRRIADIAVGSERAFLFGTALRVVSEISRSPDRRMLVDGEPGDEPDLAPGPDVLADRSRAREVLQEILMTMPLELRTVLVLFELEQMTKTEVAELLGVPVGTAASRRRRARDEFKAQFRRRQAQGARRLRKVEP
jgi:RNA polymerase sigma-70 factor (ECF subfamily)